MDINKELYKRLECEQLWEKSKEVNRNEFLKISDTTDTNLYYVVSGSLKVFFVHDGEENIIRFGYRNNFIAALDSFINEQPSDLCIQAIKHTTLKVISKERYLAFIRQNVELQNLWDIMLQQLILQQIEREKDILINSPQERYQRVLKRSPHLFQEIPHKYIAAYLRMTPETLSRIKKS